ncbi:MAG: L-threonylcarbamoyladenylate synthase [Lachnospiraceae bacterium]
MITKVLKIEEANEINVIYEAGEVIKNGGLVAFPTETVYGLGGDAFNKQSSEKIYEVKGRPSNNPLIIHIAEKKSLHQLVECVDDRLEALSSAFWPGPLTLVMKKNKEVPDETTGGLDTVAVRMPKHHLAQLFIKEAGGFVAAPSANLSGRPSPTCAKYVVEDMQGKIEMILDGGDCQVGLESTILDLTEEIPILLRPGSITKEMIEAVIGTIETDPSILEIDSKIPPRAPGMRYKHYAPKGELLLISGEKQKVVDRINKLTLECKKQGKVVGVISTKENENSYQYGVIKNIGARENEEEIAKNLYKILREFDDEHIEVIYSESFEESILGHAIMNRLLKAAGHKIEYLE